MKTIQKVEIVEIRGKKIKNTVRIKCLSKGLDKEIMTRIKLSVIMRTIINF